MVLYLKLITQIASAQDERGGGFRKMTYANIPNRELLCFGKYTSTCQVCEESVLWKQISLSSKPLSRYLSINYVSLLKLLTHLCIVCLQRIQNQSTVQRAGTVGALLGLKIRKSDRSHSYLHGLLILPLGVHKYIILNPDSYVGRSSFLCCAQNCAITMREKYQDADSPTVIQLNWAGISFSPSSGT